MNLHGCVVGVFGVGFLVLRFDDIAMGGFGIVDCSWWRRASLPVYSQWIYVVISTFGRDLSQGLRGNIFMEIGNSSYPR